MIGDPPGMTALLLSLEVAVPMWMDRAAALTLAEQRARARECADEVAAHGDVLQYGGKRGEAAAAFNRLAEGLGVLAHAPGGVGFYGVHWCAGSGHRGVRSESPCREEVARTAGDHETTEE